MLKKSIILFVLLFSFSAVSAEVVESVTKDEIYTPNTYEPNPWIIENVTITNYKNTSSSALEYEDDGGDQATIPGTVQKIYLDPMQIVSPLGLQKPIADGSENGTVWLNASAWSSANNVTLTKKTVNGVDMLEVDFTGSTGTLAKMVSLTLNESITDYDKKKYIIGVQFLDSPDSDSSWQSSVEFHVVGSNGKYNALVISPKSDLSVSYNIGQGGDILRGVAVNKMSNFSGSQVINDISSIRIRVGDSNSNDTDSIKFRVYALGFEDKVPAIGSLNDVSVKEMYENDSGVMTLDTFKPSFKWEKVTSFGPVEFKMSASDLDAKYTLVDYEELSDSDKASYTKSYDVKEYFNFTFKLPAAVDLTYDGSGVLKDTLNINSQQYDYVSVQTGTADPVQKTGLYTGSRSGDTITVLSSTSSGTTYIIYYEVLLTTAQWKGISEAVGAIYGSSDSWWNRWWLWLAGLVGLGYGVKRKRSGGK